MKLRRIRNSVFVFMAVLFGSCSVNKTGEVNGKSFVVADYEMGKCTQEINVGGRAEGRNNLAIGYGKHDEQDGTIRHFSLGYKEQNVNNRKLYNMWDLSVSASNTVPQNTTFIRLMDKNYFWALKHHYLEGHGEDILLTKEQFDNLLRHGEIDFSTAELIDDDYFVANVSFYDSDLDLHLSFGTATVKFKIENDKIEFYAFRDTYNFDPKPWGERGTVNELMVRTYNKLSKGTQFGIYYNKTLF